MMMALVVTFGSMIEWLMLACLKVDSKMTQSVNQDMSLSRPQIYIYYDIRPSSLQNQKKSVLTVYKLPVCGILL